MTSNLAGLEKLVAEASPGPWRNRVRDVGADISAFFVIDNSNPPAVVAETFQRQKESNARLAALAPTLAKHVLATPGGMERGHYLEVRYGTGCSDVALCGFCRFRADLEADLEGGGDG